MNTHFEPYGFTANPQIRIAKSFIDYIMRYLAIHFLSPEELQELGIKADAHVSSTQATLNLGGESTLKVAATPASTAPATTTGATATPTEEIEVEASVKISVQSDAPPCPSCGSMTTKTGTCYTCLSCGSTTGGCS